MNRKVNIYLVRLAFNPHEFANAQLPYFIL